MMSAPAYPDFNADSAPCEVFTITSKGMMTMNVRNTTIPVSVKHGIDRQGATAFIAVKFKIPSVASDV